MSQSPKRKLLKGWQVIVIVVIVVAMVGGGYAVYNRTTATNSTELPASTQLVAVQYGNVVNSVTASGTVAFPTREKLAFSTAGTVEANVQEGDTVKEGQVLATLESISTIPLQIAVTQARINLKNAEDNLAKAKNPYTESDINQAKLAVVNARVALTTAEDNMAKAKNPYTESDINQAKLAVVNARVALTTAEDNLAKAKNPYTESDINQAKLTVANAKIALKTAEDNYDKAYDRYALDPTNITKLQDYELRKAQLAVAQDNLAQAEKTLADMLTDANPVEVEQRQAQLVVAQANLVQAEKTLADMLAGANPVDVEQRQAQLVVAQGNLVQAGKTLVDMQAGEPLEVELQQLKVADAQDTLNEATKALDDIKTSLVIKAPFDGVVVSTSIDIGQKVTAGTAVMELVDASVAQVNAVVNEIDFSRVKPGQSVTLSIDALPDVEITGNVSTLSVFGKATSGVVSYPVTISVASPPGVQLGEAMSATATILVQQANNVLVIPNRAIGGTTGNPTVRIMVNGVLEDRAVTLGLSDDTRTQVIAGLQEGERVLVSSTSTSTSPRAFSAGGQMMQPFNVIGGGR